MDYTNLSIEEIKKWLKVNLSEERYLHSLGAMDSAKELALRFGVDEQKASFTGLIHDCAKCLSNNELEDILKNKCENFEDCELLNTKTWHAPVGAYLAKEKFGVSDSEILSAIRWHTIGRIGMSDFEMVVFLADKIEKRTREPEFRQKIEKAINKHNSLEKGILKCFKMTIKSLVKRKMTICQQTIDVYNDLIVK